MLPDVVLDVVLRKKLSLPDEVPAMLKEQSPLPDEVSKPFDYDSVATKSRIDYSTHP